MLISSGKLWNPFAGWPRDQVIGRSMNVCVTSAVTEISPTKNYQFKRFNVFFGGADFYYTL